MPNTYFQLRYVFVLLLHALCGMASIKCGKSVRKAQQCASMRFMFVVLFIHPPNPPAYPTNQQPNQPYLPIYLPTCLPTYLPACLPAYLPTQSVDLHGTSTKHDDHDDNVSWLVYAGACLHAV